jgi:anti-sigma regulatory factor (Ser/Thr protein kinase)
MIGESEVVASETLLDGDRVSLNFPARGDLVVLARLVASAIATRVGFDIEELEDLRLAVGELCLLALQGSDARHGDLQLEFTISADSLDISCTHGGAAPPDVSRNDEGAEADLVA